MAAVPSPAGSDQGRPLRRLCGALSRQEHRRGGLADRATIQLAYAIGVAEPLSIYVDLHGAGQVAEEKLEAVLPQIMRLSPRHSRTSATQQADLRANLGLCHFGRTPDADGGFSWEKTDLADKLKAHFS